MVQKAASEIAKTAFRQRFEEGEPRVERFRPVISLEKSLRGTGILERQLSQHRLHGTGLRQLIASVILGAAMLTVACSFHAWAAANVETLFEEGKRHLKTGNYDEAVLAFSEALNTLGHDGRNAHVLRLARAQAYFGKGDLKSAYRDVDEILQSNGVEGETLASVRQLRGILNLRQGRENRALEDFTAAIKTAHENDSLRSVCFANRGIAFINLGNFDRAVSDLNKAIDLDPISSFAYAGRGLAYLRQDKVESARRDGEKALSLNPDEETRKIAEKIISEMSISASGPLSVKVPMNDRGQIFVHVSFRKNGTPHRFILDTGATCSLVDRDLLEEIKHDTEVTEIGKGIVTIADGSSHKVIRYKVKTAFLFNLPLGEIEVHVFDRKVKRITNLLGVRSLRNVAVSIDTGGRRAEISRRESRGSRENRLE
jgi:tetratricopeptide (TPR) repeat protein